MCKTQCWYYTCGHWSNHRLSTCRGRFARDPEAAVKVTACSGDSLIPPISVAKALAAAIKQGKSRSPVYEYFGALRHEIEESVPRDSPLTSLRPHPRSTWAPPKPSPLRKELTIEDLEEDDVVDVDIETTGFERLELEMSDVEMLSPSASPPTSPNEEYEKHQRRPEDHTQIDPLLLASDAQVAIVKAKSLS
ncbi:hypothetical protein Slin15195_G036050 [Septoria linicola]|uniref:Uncharacterized protein n=1 Tax=Septoria linicola TaxID=215465 RepID=A0A9Q9AQM7_9PEZI|nr:hypothetical protein Slin15195_G036050 [Septoria linicola]